MKTDVKDLIAELEAVERDVWQSAFEGHKQALECRLELCEAITQSHDPETRTKLIQRRHEAWAAATRLLSHLRVMIVMLERYDKGILLGEEVPEVEA